MELHRVHVLFLDGGDARPIVVAGRRDPFGRAFEMEAVIEEEVRAVAEALEQRRAAGHLQVVPADVRHRLPRGLEPFDMTFDPAEAARESLLVRILRDEL